MTPSRTRIQQQFARKPASERGKAPGPGSIMWDTFSDLTLTPFSVPILVMQTAHPDIGAAVARYSVYKQDPWGRLVRTGFSLMRFLYGGKGGLQSEQEAIDLRALHSHIKGTHPDGTPYHAINPRSFRIVPDTFLDAVIRMRNVLGNPLSLAELDQLYQEYIDLCLLFGLRRDDIEPDYAAFQAYYDNLLLNVMTYNETVQHLMEEMMKYGPAMPFMPLPKGVWQTLYGRTAYPLMRVFTLGFLDPRFRDKHGIAWSKKDEQRYRHLVRLVRLYARLTPRALRYNPLALYIMAGGQGVATMEYSRLARMIEKNP